MLKITYDEQSRPAMVEYNGVWYGYVKNLQGDIVGIVDSNGTEAVKYSYDAWGKVMSISGSKGGTLGKANPFRYRGYVYDEETELYYLRSRYYNPEWGRFLNADARLGYDKLLDHNIYAYAKNVPVLSIDPNGKESYIMAKDEHDLITIAGDDFEETFGEVFMPPVFLTGAGYPTKVRGVSYKIEIVEKGQMIKFAGDALEILSAEGTGDIITYAGMCVGIPIDGEKIEQVAGVVSSILERLNVSLDVYKVKRYTLVLEYSYKNESVKTLSNVVFESGWGASKWVHIFGGRKIDMSDHNFWWDMRK